MAKGWPRSRESYHEKNCEKEVSIISKPDHDPPSRYGFVSFATENGVYEVLDDSSSHTLHNATLKVQLAYPPHIDAIIPGDGGQQAAASSSSTLNQLDHVQMDGHGFVQQQTGTTVVSGYPYRPPPSIYSYVHPTK